MKYMAAVLLLVVAVSAQNAPSTGSLVETLGWMTHFVKSVPPWEWSCLDKHTGLMRTCSRDYLSDFSTDGCTVTATELHFNALPTEKVSDNPEDYDKQVRIIRLRELDPVSVSAKLSTYTGYEGQYRVTFQVSDASPKIQTETDSKRGPKGPITQTAGYAMGSFPFARQDDANRFADALKHAIQLCGGKHL